MTRWRLASAVALALTCPMTAWAAGGAGAPSAAGGMPPIFARPRTALPSVSAGGDGAGGASAVGGQPAASSAAVAAPAPAVASCTEVIPEGKGRPAIKESFPRRGKTGFALSLVVEIEHGKGEAVMPGGFELREDAPEAKALKRAGFTLPHMDGPAAPTVEEFNADGRTGTKVTLSFVALPKKPGQKELTLPSLPIVMSRASGELVTLCTEPHTVLVDSPTANEPHAAPKPNPAPHRQLEEWTAARNAAIGGLFALLLGMLGYLLGRWWLRRPKVEPPPPPPRPPWEVAMEELHAVRHAGLIEQERFAEHFDRVSHAVRQYLGRRYGFDGLESTTREALRVLELVRPPPPLESIRAFLRHADLVKFANLTPTKEECEEALTRGDTIVAMTIPGAPDSSYEGPPAPVAPSPQEGT